MLSSGATPQGAILQVRNAHPAGFAISAAAPAVVGVAQVTCPAMPVQHFTRILHTYTFHSNTHECSVCVCVWLTLFLCLSVCTAQVVVELVGLRLVGAACKPGGAGTTVTIPVNSTGATAVVWCAEQAVR